MKKLLLIITCTIVLSSCGVLFGGRISQCQKKKPDTGHREIRPFALVGDIIWFPYITLPIDFATGAIYRPCQK